MFAACTAEPKAETQKNSISGECYSIEGCKGYIEQLETKAELLKVTDDLLEQPEEIKDNRLSLIHI